MRLRDDEDPIVDAGVHVLMSQNLGESWRDITGKSFGEIFAVFADPDHPDLICLGGNSIRNYIFQATDENYEWKATREWEWWPKHQTEEVSKSVYESKDRETTKQKLRETGGFQTQEITQGKPYKRMIDLSQLYKFSVPGVYKVQLVYESLWLEDPVQGEWIGSFSGQVFKVTITQAR